MKIDRRFIFKSLVAFGALLVLPKMLFAARPEKAFAASNTSDVIANLFNEVPLASDRVVMRMPDIAENGAVVPVTISTDLANVESISIIVANNPTPLAASFVFGSRSEAKVSVRIKMAQSSPVSAVVKAGGKLYSAEKEVKVTIGGCGG